MLAIRRITPARRRRLIRPTLLADRYHVSIMTTKTKTPMQAEQAIAPDEALEGARRATGVTSLQEARAHFPSQGYSYLHGVVRS